MLVCNLYPLSRKVSLITKLLLTNRRYAEELPTAIHCYKRKYVLIRKFITAGSRARSLMTHNRKALMHVKRPRKSTYARTRRQINPTQSNITFQIMQTREILLTALQY